MKRIFFLLVALAPIFGAEAPASLDALPVLHQQRIKPFAVAAEEIVLSITGKPRFGLTEVGETEIKITTKMKPVDLVLDLMLDADAWRARPLLYVPYLPLQEQLHLPGQWASLQQLDDPSAQALMVQALQKQRAAKQNGEVVEMRAIDRAIVSLAERQAEAESVLSGREISLAPLAANDAQRDWVLQKLLPQLDDRALSEGRAWISQIWPVRERAVKGLDPSEGRNLLAVQNPWLTIDDLALRPDARFVDWPNQPVKDAAKAWGDALRGNANLDAATATLTAALRASGIDAYPSNNKIHVELLYRNFKPFTWAWLLYIAGGIITALGARGANERRRGVAAHTGIALTVAAIVCTLIGLGIRLVITQLGAVTNLYETLIYVSLIVGILGLVFAFTTRNALYVVAAGLGAGMCAMIGEAIPPELGANITQLQPVLRSRFWLFVHVKTVVASYGAFLLALVIGNIVLAKAAIEKRAVQADEARSIYRSLQVGVVLIAAGTLLGGFWAAEAWGRFWGWDPKEVWALVILLTYLIPLHLRYAGVVGPTGIAAWSVFGFLSVIMSWYGVNFILGTGLHAYAFGSGGQSVVLPLCGLQVIVTTIQLLVIRSARKPADS